MGACGSICERTGVQKADQPATDEPAPKADEPAQNINEPAQKADGPIVAPDIHAEYSVSDPRAGKSQDATSYQIALKAPHGVEMRYIDGEKWVHGRNINEWIGGLYRDSDYDHWVVYNDEVEGHNVTASHGHCKGILAWNSTHISWLIHSVPKFPAKFDGTYIAGIAAAEQMYGQSFIFIDQIGIGALDAILTQLRIMNPYIYISTVGYTLPTTDHKVKMIMLTREVMHVAKSGRWGQDIYEHLAGEFGGEWVCETWVRGHECADSKAVKDAQKIRWGKHEYRRTQDHSKYACSDMHTYVGDINRMLSQFHRGGGGIVIRDATICALFREIMICPPQTKRDVQASPVLSPVTGATDP